ncbi:MAG: hypothetical protein KatS3mg115_1378 [Candidatus Poribacteria bacterium]|nr:MAG: hypothetical protein KatS3mg115_1378 [Candidatus Poribacteria bacterium]
MTLSAMIGEESIPSKQGLREERRHKLLRWLREQTPPLRLEEYPFWSDEQKAAEAAAFAQFDQRV